MFSYGLLFIYTVRTKIYILLILVVRILSSRHFIIILTLQAQTNNSILTDKISDVNYKFQNSFPGETKQFPESYIKIQRRAHYFKKGKGVCAVRNAKRNFLDVFTANFLG